MDLKIKALEHPNSTMKLKQFFTEKILANHRYERRTHYAEYIKNSYTSIRKKTKI
jgi:hypothetical protein